MHGSWGGAGGRSGQCETNLPQDRGWHYPGHHSCQHSCRNHLCAPSKETRKDPQYCVSRMWNRSWRRRSRLQAWPPGSFPTLSLQPSMLLQIWTVSCTFWGHTRISSCATLNPVNPGIVSGQYPLEEGPLSQMSEAVSNFFAGAVFWQIWILVRWTTWTSWVMGVRWVRTPRAPRTPLASLPHPSPLELDIRAPVVGSTGIFTLVLSLANVQMWAGIKTGVTKYSHSIVILLTHFSLSFFSAEKNKDFTDNIKSDFSLEDLNFDPAAIIGEGTGDWGVSHLLFPIQCLLFSTIFVFKLLQCKHLGHDWIFFQQLNNMDPGDLLSFLDGPGDLATPPSSGAHHHQKLLHMIKSISNGNLRYLQYSWYSQFSQVPAQRRVSKGATPPRTTSYLSSTESRTISVDPCIFTWDLLPPSASLFNQEGHLPLVLYYASHLPPNLGPRIWGLLEPAGALLPHPTLAPQTLGALWRACVHISKHRNQSDLSQPWKPPSAGRQNVATRRTSHRARNVQQPVYKSKPTSRTTFDSASSVKTISARYSSLDYWKSIGKLFEYRIFLESMY